MRNSFYRCRNFSFFIALFCCCIFYATHSTLDSIHGGWMVGGNGGKKSRSHWEISVLAHLTVSINSMSCNSLSCRISDYKGHERRRRVSCKSTTSTFFFLLKKSDGCCFLPQPLSHYEKVLQMFEWRKEIGFFPAENELRVKKFGAKWPRQTGNSGFSFHQIQHWQQVLGWLYPGEKESSADTFQMNTKNKKLNHFDWIEVLIESKSWYRTVKVVSLAPFSSFRFGLAFHSWSFWWVQVERVTHSIAFVSQMTVIFPTKIKVRFRFEGGGNVWQF